MMPFLWVAWASDSLPVESTGTSNQIPMYIGTRAPLRSAYKPARRAYCVPVDYDNAVTRTVGTGR